MNDRLSDDTTAALSSFDEEQAECGRAFSPGVLLANRYQIVRFLAAGGMGEVYEANDLDLGERVALKTILRGATDSESAARFKREINLARRVTHPNVARIFDIGHEGSLMFLTMELLEGETLSDRLMRAGRLSLSEALPIIRQIAAGLDAAHRAGIVHRDLKSANVMLVGDAAEPRAVVMDFGLARAHDGHDRANTATGTVIGTPDYMAPEQLQAGRITSATDIYALGVVMYEMVTGERPFSGATAFETAAKRLTEDPSSPRVHVEDLDVNWERVILRCLARRAEDRYQDARAVVDAITTPSLVRPPRAKRWWLAASLIVVAVFCIGAIAWSRIHTVRDTAKRPSIAVFGFLNRSGRPDVQWLSTAMGEMLNAELAAGDQMRTIPGENVARMKIDLELADTDSFGTETLARIHKYLGADYIVLGSYVDLGKESGGQIRVKATLQDTRRGETITIVQGTGTEAKLFPLVSEAGAELRRKLGIRSVASPDVQAIQAALPNDTNAARLYSEGLVKVRTFDPLAARELLEHAIAIEPDFPLAHVALADAWSALGYDKNASAESETALKYAGQLSREEKLLIEARCAESRGEGERAIELYRSLWNFFPDNLEHGLRLAEALDDANHATEAAAMIAALRRLPPPACNDPRIDLDESAIAYDVSEWPRALATANNAIHNATLRGDRVLLDRAYMMRGAAYSRLQQYAEAEADLQQTLSVARACGDGFGEARALNFLAVNISNRGDLTRAHDLYIQAIAAFEKIGNRTRLASAKNNLGVNYWYQGHLREAEALFGETLEIGPIDSFYLNNVALVRIDRGDFVKAEDLLNRAIALSDKKTDKYSLGWHHYARGRLYAWRGNEEEARKELDTSLAFRSASGAKGDAAESELAIADLLVDEGRAGEALPIIQRCIAEFQAEKSKASEWKAYVSLARAHLAVGQIQDARNALRDASSIANPAYFAYWMRYQIVSARLDQNDEQLRQVIEQTRQRGFPGLTLEARLALAEIRHTGVQSLISDARAQGYDGIARRAERLK